jgi:hypothetical protein
MNTNIINAGISNVNASRQANVEQQAGVLIGDIVAARVGISRCESVIADLQKELLKLNSDEITVKSITGVDTLPSTSNTSSIVKVIETMNKTRQDSVALTSTRLTKGVLDQQSAIKALNETIAKKQEELKKLSYEEVTPEVVLGAEATV